MNDQQLKHLASQLLDGKVSLDQFVAEVAAPQTARLDETSLDLDRARRCGYPEVIFGEGKSVAALLEILAAQQAAGVAALATRVSLEKAEAVAEQFPTVQYNKLGRTLRLPLVDDQSSEQPEGAAPRVAVVTAGTSDRSVAEEARETAEWMGAEVNLVLDVGVAGPHRLPERLDEVISCDAVIVVAGMEGALPSIVGGYVRCPVIAVPTSVGYGASFGGVAALLGMLNSCAANVAVVNIDAGFKAGYLAGLVATRRQR